MKRLLPLLLLIFSFIATIAQTSGPTPAQTLRLARATYEQGRLHEIPEQLDAAVITKMTKQEKVEAYRILCLTYIYLEEPAKADESMLNLLRTDPYFQINPAVDPAEFVGLYYTFRTLPIYRFGARLGVSGTFPTVTELNTAVELAPGSKYSPLIGILFGMSFDKPLNKRMELHAELLYLQKRFKIVEIVDRGIDIDTGEPLYHEFIGTETQSWVSLPLCFEYKFLSPNSKFGNKFNPYISGGISADYIIKSEITAERNRDNQSAVQEQTSEPIREKFNLSALVSAGIKMRIGGGYFVSEIRYMYGLMPVSSSETAYENNTLTWNTGYADPVFKVNSLGLTLSYVQNVFNPKKLKRKK